MKPSLHQRPDGIALVMVMIVIIALSVLAGVFAYSMKVETRLARNADSETQLIWLGRSGVDTARAILSASMSTPNQQYDSLNQIWAGGPGGNEETNNALSGFSLKNNEVGGGAFSVTIEDLESKFNINMADEETLQNALNIMGVDASDMPMIIDSILDWTDPDDDPHINGTESDFYENLPPPEGPYICKNGPVDSMPELLLVRGVTPPILWGNKYASHGYAWFQPIDKFGRELNMPTNSLGLDDLFTPISQGRVNINTASASVLQLLGMDETAASLIVKQRAGPDGVDGTDDDVPFRNVGEVRTVGLSLPAVQQLQKIASVRSATFKVTVDAQVNGYHKYFYAILARTSATDIQILSFYWKSHPE